MGTIRSQLAGKASVYLHRIIISGDRLNIESPINKFAFRD